MQNNIAVEKNLLGHLMYFAKVNNNDAIYQVINRADERWFTEEKHRIIYRAIVEVFVKAGRIDSVQVLRLLNSTGQFERAGGMDYIGSLISGRSLATSLDSLLSLFVDDGRKRDLRKLCTDSIKRLDTDTLVESSNIIETLEKEISILRGYDKDTMVDIAAEAREIIRKSSEIENNGCYGFSWGLPFLDSVTGGIEIGKTYVAGATKKSGKTKFVINTIYALHQQKVPSFFLSLEMNGEGVTKELMTRFTSIGNDVFKSKICAADEQALAESVHSISQYLSIDRETGLNLMQVRHKMDMAARRGCKVVFMDYLQRMDFKFSKNGGITYATTIGNVVIGLADAAKELGVALVFLSQLSNVAEGQNAGIEHLKESGGIAEGVDCIFILNNQDRINKNYTNKTNEVWIAIEQRSGRSGMLKCRVDLSTDTYWEVESVHKPEP